MIFAAAGAFAAVGTAGTFLALLFFTDKEIYYGRRDGAKYAYKYNIFHKLLLFQ